MTLCHVTLQIESLCSADDTLKEKLEVLCQYFSIEEEEDEEEEEERQFNHISSLLSDFDERIKLDQLLKVSYNYSIIIINNDNYYNSHRKI